MSKVYRAFPELDPFSDAECGAYVRHVRRRNWIGVIVVPLLALVMTFLLAVFGSIVFGALAMPWGNIDSALGAALSIAMVIVPMVLPLVVMWLVRDRMLRRGLRRQIATAACVSCGYSLLGLPVQAGEVTCPECGHQHDLQRHGLRPEDLIARAQREPAEAPAP